MKKRILPLLLGGLMVLTMFGCGSKDSDEEISKEKEPTEKIGVIDESDNTEEQSEDVEVFEGKAKGEDYFTGTYEDKELKATIKIVADMENGTAVMSFNGISGLSEDDNEEVATKDNVISDEGYSYVGGKYGTVIWTNKDDKDYIQFSPGVGEPWGDFRRTSKKATIKIESGSYDENQEKEREKAKEEFNTLSPLERLRSFASLGNCDSYIDEEQEEQNRRHDLEEGDIGYFTALEDDNTIFDEVVLGYWYNEDGSPKAEMFPEGGMGAVPAEWYHFVDGSTVTMDQVKRSTAGSNDVYAMILNVFDKGKDENGNIYINAIEYTSGEVIVVHPNYDSLVYNYTFDSTQIGDDLLVFANYRGLATDDTPNFKVSETIENLNSRNIEKFK